MKMKKILALLLPVLLAVSLAGCAPSSSTPSSYAVSDAQVFLDAGVFDGEMSAVDLDTVAMLYGIDRATIQDGVCYLAANTSVSADELTILLFTDEAAAQAAETACEKRLDSQLANAKNYTPAAVPRLEGAVIRRQGASILLVVGDPSSLPGVADQLGT